MTLPVSANPISLNQIQTEFTGANPISMSEYRAGGPSGYVPSGTLGYPGGVATAIPSSTNIKFSNFFGASRFLVVQNEFVFNNNTEQGYDIAVDSSGNYYVVGTYIDGGPTTDGFIIKYDSQGNIVWCRTMSSPSNMTWTSGAIDSSGNIYVSGSSNSPTQGLFDIIVAKYNSSGTIQWQRRLGTSEDEGGQGIVVDSSGNIYISSGIGSSGTYRGLTIKLDSTGATLWQRRWDLPGSLAQDFGGRVALEPGGANIYVCAQRTVSPPDQGGGNIANGALIKYNSSGVIQWIRTLSYIESSFSQQTYIKDAVVSSAGDIYVTGHLLDETGPMFLIKFNSAGTVQWQRRSYFTDTALYGGGQGIALDSSNNVYVAGFSGMIWKYNSAGTLIWAKRSQEFISAGENQQYWAIKTSSGGNFYASGTAFTSGYYYNNLYSVISILGSSNIASGSVITNFANQTVTEQAFGGTITTITATETAVTVSNLASTLTDAAYSTVGKNTRIVR